jgi:hypothetical protein
MGCVYREWGKWRLLVLGWGGGIPTENAVAYWVLSEPGWGRVWLSQAGGYNFVCFGLSPRRASLNPLCANLCASLRENPRISDSWSIEKLELETENKTPWPCPPPIPPPRHLMAPASPAPPAWPPGRPTRPARRPAATAAGRWRPPAPRCPRGPVPGAVRVGLDELDGVVLLQHLVREHGQQGGQLRHLVLMARLAAAAEGGAARSACAAAEPGACPPPQPSPPPARGAGGVPVAPAGAGPAGRRSGPAAASAPPAGAPDGGGSAGRASAARPAAPAARSASAASVARRSRWRGGWR